MKRIFKYIKRKIAEAKAEREEENRREKERIAKELTNPMTERQVENYNITLIANSGGWIGGDYSEKEIKMRILIEHKNKFSDQEISDIKKKIKG